VQSALADLLVRSRVHGKHQKYRWTNKVQCLMSPKEWTITIYANYKHDDAVNMLTVVTASCNWRTSLGICCFHNILCYYMHCANRAQYTYDTYELSSVIIYTILANVPAFRWYRIFDAVFWHLPSGNFRSSNHARKCAFIANATLNVP